MPQSVELQAKIAVWRAKAVEGTLTQEEMKEAIIIMREGRKSAGASGEGTTRRAKAKAAIPSADDMLSELGA